MWITLLSLIVWSSNPLPALPSYSISFFSYLVPEPAEGIVYRLNSSYRIDSMLKRKGERIFLYRFVMNAFFLILTPNTILVFHSSSTGMR